MVLAQIESCRSKTLHANVKTSLSKQINIEAKLSQNTRNIRHTRWNLCTCCRNFSSCTMAALIAIAFQRISSSCFKQTQHLHTHSHIKQDPKRENLRTLRSIKMLAKNSSKLVQAKWSAQLLFVPEKNKTPSFCVVYRNLNAVARRNIYPISNMHRCSSSIYKAVVVSTMTLDAKNDN